MPRLNTFQKIKAIAVLAIIFLLVLATNMMDSSHFKIVKLALSTVYEDRLVAKNHLYKIAGQLQLKNNTFQTGESEEIVIVNEMTNDSIQTLVNKYAGTKLTPREAQKFESLRNELNRLNELEQQFQNEMYFNKNSEVAESLKIQFTTVSAKLDALADIQLHEGRREIYRSNQAIATSDMLFRLEIGSLIVLALVILFVILYKPLDIRSIGKVDYV